MQALIYPTYPFKIQQVQGKDQIFDPFRKSWIILTPEEWVRQNTLQYLVQTCNYPSSSIAVEKTIQLGELNKRFDIVVYKNEHPFLLVECKEMNVPISQKTLEQVMRYNISLQAAYFVITNGTDCFAFKKQDGDMVGVDVFPIF